LADADVQEGQQEGDKDAADPAEDRREQGTDEGIDQCQQDVCGGFIVPSNMCAETAGGSPTALADSPLAVAGTPRTRSDRRASVLILTKT
jgi:hypothetical protein